MASRADNKRTSIQPQAPAIPSTSAVSSKWLTIDMPVLSLFRSFRFIRVTFLRKLMGLQRPLARRQSPSNPLLWSNTIRLNCFLKLIKAKLYLYHFRLNVFKKNWRPFRDGMLLIFSSWPKPFLSPSCLGGFWLCLTAKPPGSTTKCPIRTSR